MEVHIGHRHLSADHIWISLIGEDFYIYWTKKMKILLLNAQAISTAYADLVNTVHSYNVDILCVNETHQKEGSNFRSDVPCRPRFDELSSRIK